MEPIVEQIAAATQTTLENISVADGYHYDLQCVRSKSSDFADVMATEGTVLLAQVGLEKSSDGPAMVDTYNAGFVIEGFVIDSAGTAIDTKANRLYADIAKALAIDTTRGGLAIQTIIQSVNIFHTENNFIGVDIEININYRTKYGDPYTGA